MISKDKQYRTVDGRQVRIYAVDSYNNCYPVHGAILEADDSWHINHWEADGTCFGYPKNHLVEVHPRHKRTVWLNMYRETGTWPDAYTAKIDCDNVARNGRIACIKVELDFEEGEGLS